MVFGFALSYLDNGFETNKRRQLDELEPNLETWPSFLASCVRYEWHEDIVEWFDVMRMSEIGVNVEAPILELIVCANLIVFGKDMVNHVCAIKGGV